MQPAAVLYFTFTSLLNQFFSKLLHYRPHERHHKKHLLHHAATWLTMSWVIFSESEQQLFLYFTSEDPLVSKKLLLNQK